MQASAIFQRFATRAQRRVRDRATIFPTLLTGPDICLKNRETPCKTITSQRSEFEKNGTQRVRRTGHSRTARFSGTHAAMGDAVEVYRQQVFISNL